MIKLTMIEFEIKLRELMDSYIDLYSNTYISKYKLEQFICENTTVTLCDTQYLVIIYWENEIRKMYYIGTLTGIEDLLFKVKNDKSYAQVIVELLGDYQAVEVQAKIFANMGICQLGRYSRWKASRILKLVPRIEMNVSVEKAEEKEIDTIMEVINETFDKRMDHLPSKDELVQMIESGLVFVLCYQEECIGVLCIKRLKNQYMYLFLEAIRNKYIDTGVGILFLQKVFEAFNDCKYVSWTNDSNNRSNHMHEYFGFKRDGIVNYIYTI